MANVAADSKGVVAADRSYDPRSATRHAERDGGDAPGCESRGSVEPSIARPVLTASRPSKTMQNTGPDSMYVIKPGKKDLPLRSA
jgi:hypothetical protein